MRIRTAAVAAAALLLPLTACGTDTSDSDTDSKPTTAEPAPSKREDDKAGEHSGLPDAPTGAARKAYLDGLRAIDPFFVDDKGEKDAIDNGRNQCSSLDGDNAVQSAQLRFGKGPEREVTEAEAKQINELVREHICPEA